MGKHQWLESLQKVKYNQVIQRTCGGIPSGQPWAQCSGSCLDARLRYRQPWKLLLIFDSHVFWPHLVIKIFIRPIILLIMIIMVKKLNWYSSRDVQIIIFKSNLPETLVSLPWELLGVPPAGNTWKLQSVNVKTHIKKSVQSVKTAVFS